MKNLYFFILFLLYIFVSFTDEPIQYTSDQVILLRRLGNQLNHLVAGKVFSNIQLIFIDCAANGLRLSGNQDDLPRGLFARAELYRLQGNYHSAWDDLEEAHDIAERGEMQLWLTDYHLLAGRVISHQLPVSSLQWAVIRWLKMAGRLH